MILGTILVVEDDVGVGTLLVDILTDEGHTMQRVSSGSDALAALQTDRFDLMLLDLYLPGTSGWAVLEAARAQQIDVPIVIMTVGSVSDDELVAAGARACLYKPFDLNDLLICTAEHMRRRSCQPGCACSKGDDRCRFSGISVASRSSAAPVHVARTTS